MSFGIALSGINAAQADLAVTANNVANSQTTGFKQARSEFAELFAVSPQGVSRTQTGHGVKLTAVAQQFTQGNVEATSNSLDLAISGQGFFVLSDSGAMVYTRAGAFQTDNAGYVVNSEGQRLQVYPVTERAAKALSETVTPSGLVAVCRLPATGLDEVLAGQPGLVVVAVDLSEPGNAGTLIRLSDAMGAAAVVFAGHSVDPYNGKCLRSSAGSIFALPVIVEPDTAVVAARLRSSGLQVLATTLDGELSLDDTGTLLSASTAWLFGGEAHGLSTEVAALADHRVRIPMSGGAESLNVAAAAAICLYQSAQARRGAGPPGADK